MRGAGLLVEAARLLRREPSLRLPALAPFLISAVALAAAAAGIFAYSGDLFALVTGWMPWPEPSAWYAWLWVAPLRLVFGALGVVLFLVASAIALAASFLVAGIVASPFHDVLSRRVERAVTGNLVDSAAPVLGVAFADLTRVALFLSLQGSIFLVGLVPGAQVVAAPALVLVTIFFLPIEYASYALDRRAVRAKIAWVRAHLGLALGFGAAACLLCAIPVANFAALPILVTAGTLLVLRVEGSGSANPQS